MASSLYRDTSDSDSRGLNDPQVRLHSRIQPECQQDFLIGHLSHTFLIGLHNCYDSFVYLKHQSGFVAKWTLLVKSHFCIHLHPLQTGFGKRSDSPATVDADGSDAQSVDSNLSRQGGSSSKKDTVCHVSSINAGFM